VFVCNIKKIKLRVLGPFVAHWFWSAEELRLRRRVYQEVQRDGAMLIMHSKNLLVNFRLCDLL